MYKLKIVFLAYYPTTTLPRSYVVDILQGEHPASWIVNLSKAISERIEVELHIVSDSPNVIADVEVVENNINFHFIKTPTTLNLSTLYIISVYRLIRKLKEIAPDVVHAHGCEGSIGIAGIWSGLPCLVSTQGLLTAILEMDKYWFGRASLRTTLLAAIERYVLKRARYVGTRTEYATEVVKRHNPSAQIQYTPEVMNKLFFDVIPDLDSHHLVYVGSIIERKDVLTLVRAMGILSKIFVDCRLSVVGTGPASYIEVLQEEIRVLQLERKVTFHGFLSSEAIARLFTESSVFVLPSLIENSPNALAEAMCSGLAVVATDVGGIPSLVENGVSGVLVSPRDPDAIAKAIEDLWTNKEKLKNIATQARAKALRTHTASLVSDQMIAVYKRILEHEEQRKVA